MTLFSPLKEGVDLSYVIKPDYGTLEERLAKRQNLPIELDGDGKHVPVRKPQLPRSATVSAHESAESGRFLDPV